MVFWEELLKDMRGIYSKSDVRTHKTSGESYMTDAPNAGRIIARYSRAFEELTDIFRLPRSSTIDQVVAVARDKMIEVVDPDYKAYNKIKAAVDAMDVGSGDADLAKCVEEVIEIATDAEEARTALEALDLLPDHKGTPRLEALVQALLVRLQEAEEAKQLLQAVAPDSGKDLTFSQIATAVVEQVRSADIDDNLALVVRRQLGE